MQAGIDEGNPMAGRGDMIAGQPGEDGNIPDGARVGMQWPRGLGREVAAALEDKDFARLERALYSHAQLDESDSLGCLIWQGGKTSSGYGYLQTPDGKQLLVHRILGYAVAGFPAPRGRDENVGHACAKKLCISSHHLSLVTVRQNTQEGLARYELHKLIREITAADVEGPGSSETPDPDLCRVVNAIDDLRDRGMTQREAIARIGVINRTTYERQRKRHWPDRVKSKLRPNGIEESIANKDATAILRYVRNKVTRDTTTSSCWNWTGKLTGEYPSTGTMDTHRYVQRVVEWSVRGCPGTLRNLPPVWRHCGNILCLNPAHLRLITECLGLIKPELRIPLLTKIAQLGGVVDSTQLDRARLAVEFAELVPDSGR